MVKKRVTKKKTAKKKVIKKHHKPQITQSMGEVKVERILVQNFVSLQKVMTNLSVKIDQLTTKTSKLLDLFELSAKALAEKNFDVIRPETHKEDKNSKKILEKMDKMLDQNKTIAKGLTLMHEKEPEPVFHPKQVPKRFPGAPQKPASPGLIGYQKSISSEMPEPEEVPND